MIGGMIGFTLGAVTWSLAEYCIHRFVGHGRKRRPVTGLSRLLPSGRAAEFNAEHLAHHADPTYFAATSRKVLPATAVIGSLGALLTIAAGAAIGLPSAAGFALAYAAYEVLHRRIHTHPPKGRYSRWMRRHHLYHHHRSPRTNHGVTSPLWDQLFGSEVLVEEPIAIPRRLAPRWLLDPTTGTLSPREGFTVLG
ncbi:MAG: hypothetical protein EXR72_20415 [Myxococcales bacterium]|nr:hypothetical protein [Myxococcales bacterium]